MNEMTDSEADTPIQEFVEFLDQYAPDELNDLQRLYPSAAAGVLNPKGICGDTVPLSLAVDACLRSMKSGITICNQHLEPMSNRLRQANSLQTYGKIASAVSSASLFGLLQQENRLWAYVAAGISLIGTLLPDIAKHFAQTLNTKDDLSKTHETIVSLKSQAFKIEGKLKLCKCAGYPEKIGTDDTESIVEKGLDLVVAIRKELETAGIKLPHT